MTQDEKLLKMGSVLEIVQISKTKLYDLMKNGEFPTPRKIGGNSLWLYSEIQEYIQKVIKG
jgi:prophage regulatory protein